MSYPLPSLGGCGKGAIYIKVLAEHPRTLSEKHRCFAAAAVAVAREVGTVQYDFFLEILRRTVDGEHLKRCSSGFWLSFSLALGRKHGQLLGEER